MCAKGLASVKAGHRHVVHVHMGAGGNILCGDTYDVAILGDLLTGTDCFQGHLVPRRDLVTCRQAGRSQRCSGLNLAQGHGDIIAVVQRKDLWAVHWVHSLMVFMLDEVWTRACALWRNKAINLRSRSACAAGISAMGMRALSSALNRFSTMSAQLTPS